MDARRLYAVYAHALVLVQNQTTFPRPRCAEDTSSPRRVALKMRS